MKAKTIEKTIHKKMEDFISSISDKTLQESLKRNIVVTGGCITSMFQQEQVNDYDIYLKSARSAYLVAKYYAKKMNVGRPDVCAQLRVRFAKGLDCSKSMRTLKDFYKEGAVIWRDVEGEIQAIIDTNVTLSEHLLNNITRTEVFVRSNGVIEETKSEGTEEKPEKYRPVFLSSNAITLSHKVQIVLRFTGQPEDIHKTYDFAHATNYWTYKEGLVTNIKALECILARELIYRGSVYPLASIFRSRKFIKRGWSMHIGNYVKMALQLNELDLCDPKVLEDQLTGVDMAYMHQVITAVKTKLAEDKNFNFNATYLCEIVDRLMGEQHDESHATGTHEL